MMIRFAFLFVLSIFWPMLAFGQSPEILNQAKKEGEVILYTTMTVRDFEFFSKAAKEKYPFSGKQKPAPGHVGPGRLLVRHHHGPAAYWF